MEPKRLRLLELVVSGDSVTPAQVGFVPGLNLIVGASDTGKTFIFEAIDFMLGGSGPLRRVPESKGYDRVFLSIEPTDRPAFTLQRAFSGGQFEVIEHVHGQQRPDIQSKKLSAQHTVDPDGSLSAYLLRAIGIEGRSVRKNEKGEKTALSFRDVAHLALINETKIIGQVSAILTGQVLNRTREKNVFAFFMTNQDDSQIIPQEDPKDRNKRLAIEATTIESILSDKRKELDVIGSDSSELADQATRLEASIREATQAVITNQDEIISFQQQRSQMFDRRTSASSRIKFLSEQLKRLRLLSLYYQSDRDRLNAVLEASRIYHELPEGSCPLCDRPFQPKEHQASPHEQFEESCVKEIQKIDVLQSDLHESIQDFTNEEADLQIIHRQLGVQLQTISNHLERVLASNSRIAQSDLQELIQKRTSVAQSEMLKTTIKTLEDRLALIEVARTQRIPRSSFANRATTSVAFEFCQIVETILRSWNYPNLGTVSFDTDKGDLVIGGQDRADKGKGYRAVTYAAFAIGLMKYCRLKNIPHPGFVVLDTPMNPFKGPDPVAPDEFVSTDVKLAFYEYLANQLDGDQVIIMENEEPPDAILAFANYIHFSGNLDVNRAGFFPVARLD